jgi:hypothetical protein
MSIEKMDVAKQDDFDDWHRNLCGALASASGYPFSVGQAQKWINMTFKYVFVLNALGEQELRGLSPLYEFCHAPLDRRVVGALVDHNLDPLPCSWSRLNCYGTYLELQRSLRTHFNAVPLTVEFQLWMRRSVDCGCNAIG